MHVTLLYILIYIFINLLQQILRFTLLQRSSILTKLDNSSKNQLYFDTSGVSLMDFNIISCKWNINRKKNTFQVEEKNITNVNWERRLLMEELDIHSHIHTPKLTILLSEVDTLYYCSDEKKNLLKKFILQIRKENKDIFWDLISSIFFSNKTRRNSEICPENGFISRF